MMGDYCHSTQIIDGDGVFNVDGLDCFLEAIRLPDSYMIVSITGPRSSGKSTLLNRLFGTNFEEMDASRGRIQTTKGIWIAKGIGIEPCTIVMDLEANDGSEREDTTLEKQNTLFALLISDVVLINLWCHDTDSEHAFNKPLFKKVFQVIPRFIQHKRSLVFVFRDKTKEKIPILNCDIQKIWQSISPPDMPDMNEFFKVVVSALPNFEEEEELFLEEVALLRMQFNLIPLEGLPCRVPASMFSEFINLIWKIAQKQINVSQEDVPSSPAVKIDDMVFTMMQQFEMTRSTQLRSTQLQIDSRMNDMVKNIMQKFDMMQSTQLQIASMTNTQLQITSRSNEFSQNIQDRLVAIELQIGNLNLLHSLIDTRIANIESANNYFLRMVKEIWSTQLQKDSRTIEISENILARLVGIESHIANIERRQKANNSYLIGMIGEIQANAAYIRSQHRRDDDNNDVGSSA